jgi:hypothetical protein
MQQIKRYQQCTAAINIAIQQFEHPETALQGRFASHPEAP